MDRWDFRLTRLGAALLLWCFLAQTALAARATSITLDEPLHITSGYACLLTGDYRLVEEHPPFLKMLQAAPLLMLEPPLADPRTVSGWESGDLIEVARHVVVAHRPIDPLVFAARVPTMLVGVLLGALVFRWATDLLRAGGDRRLTRATHVVPLVALLLYAFDPNMLAHAGVAATDLGAAATIFASTYLVWRWLRTPEPQWRRAAVVAVALGTALGTKNTALLLGPVFAVLVVITGTRRRALVSYLGQGAVIALGAGLVLWGLYRFEVGVVPGLAFPIPAPSHLLPLQKLQRHMRDGHSAFLLGENYHHGDWRYFPIALLLKTPPLTLLLGVWAGAYGLKRMWRHSSSRDLHLSALSLALFPFFYFAMSLASGINIGYRHLLPILPFVYVAIAVCIGEWTTKAPKAWSLPGAKRSMISSRATLCTAGTILLAGYVLVTLGLHPWHLAYFNLLAGGPDGGYRYLVDSNLDWGQTWKALRAYLDGRGVEAFYLSSYTINDPRAYGLDYEPLPPWPEAPPVLPQRLNPPAGVYAISTTQLQGVVVADPEMFDYFRKLEPTARIGHAMHVYDVPQRPPVDWVAQCVVPVPLLSDEAVRAGLGLDSATPHLTFDCEQSWLMPPGHGRYITPLSREADVWRPVPTGRLAYEQTRAGFVPPFAVYEAAPNDEEPTPANQPAVLADVGDSLTFLGYNAPPSAAGKTAIVETWWRVRQRPAQPLSLMAHLVGPGGDVVAVGDGLGVSVEQWVPGSLLIQRHALAIPEDVEPGTYSLSVGAYTFPDLDRLPVTLPEGQVSDAFAAGTLEVVAP